MEVDAMVCDHALVADGKLFINGAGICLLWSTPAPPHLANFALAFVVQVPYTATNQPHSFRVHLVDEDGQAVVPWAPGGADRPGPVELGGDFNVGRPPQLPHGDAQPVPFALNFTQLPFEKLGMYSVIIELNGTEVRRLPIRVLQPIV